MKKESSQISSTSSTIITLFHQLLNIKKCTESIVNNIISVKSLITNLHSWIQTQNKPTKKKLSESEIIIQLSSTNKNNNIPLNNNNNLNETSGSLVNHFGFMDSILIPLENAFNLSLFTRINNILENEFINSDSEDNSMNIDLHNNTHTLIKPKYKPSQELNKIQEILGIEAKFKLKTFHELIKMEKNKNKIFKESAFPNPFELSVLDKEILNFITKSEQTICLSNCQYEFLQKAFHTKNFVYLNGRGGTGKTFILCFVIYLIHMIKGDSNILVLYKSKSGLNSFKNEFKRFECLLPKILCLSESDKHNVSVFKVVI